MNFFLEKIKREGFKPKNILDIGAERGTWSLSALKFFPDSEYTLIEPIPYKQLNKLKNRFEVFNIILNEYDGEVDWYEMKNTGDSIKKERTHHFTNCVGEKRPCKKLDTLNVENKKVFDLVKIDVQGAEIEVLEGGKETFKETTFIILELPFMGQYNSNTKNLLEHIKKLDDMGFIPYDIVDQHRYQETMLFQIDMCFINKTSSIVNKMQDRIDSMGK